MSPAAAYEVGEAEGLGEALWSGRKPARTSHCKEGGRRPRQRRLHAERNGQRGKKQRGEKQQQLPSRWMLRAACRQQMPQAVQCGPEWTPGGEHQIAEGVWGSWNGEDTAELAVGPSGATAAAVSTQGHPCIAGLGVIR